LCRGSFAPSQDETEAVVVLLVAVAAEQSGKEKGTKLDSGEIK
jgi:hypothetical protein